ncbi:raffinose synthase [Chlorella sorokiniana]|uniref:galactinol--sucrose galactosyltransferase n=1 Tax=Chlorella sorokiniana TaxID=3076 RepID=A0A2P6TQ81_CHLSO|nr:raffinose synthase [Chlorella sorokiniana]|eukprot:PRW56188.1 raffinose synthase [Chlorella sorokiniana]
MSLQAVGRCLRAGGGAAAALLEALPPEATVRPDAASSGAIVGLNCACEPSSFLEIAVGRLRCRRFLALARAKLYWMVPCCGGPAAEQLPVETQLLLLELEDGSYGLLAPLIERDAFRASIRPPRPRRDQPGSVLLRLETGDESVKANRKVWGVLYAAAGTDPYELLDRGVAAAARLSGSSRPRWEKPVPASLDVFGWCSWDAMYTGVNPRGLQEGLRALAQGGTPARLLIIDDGWQQMDVDPQYKSDAEQGVLRRYLSTAPGELEHRLAVGRLLAGKDLQAVEPLRVMELLSRRASASGSLDPGLVREGTVGAIRSLAYQAFLLLRKARRGAEMAAARKLKELLEDTSSDSIRLRAFAAAAVGPLRTAILKFYAQASSHSYRLLSLKANGKFESINSGDEAPLNSCSEHFGEVVRELKQRCNLTYVLCWNKMGYWSGCMPGAPGVAKYNPRLMYPRPSPGTLEVDPSMQWVHPAVNGVAIAADPRPLHNDLHTYLAECGVDGVKVDVQSTITMFGFNSGGYAAMGARWHRSLEESVAQHLPGGHQINSMCCAIEDIYNMPHSNIARVSEDFYPALPASHTAHIANATFTTLMLGVVAFPDWDMFHSDHGAAHLHATARAISGGMVYTSDRVGEHDFSLLRRLVLPDGSGKQPGHAAGGSTWAVRRRSYHTHDTRPPTLAAEVRPADVPYLRPAARYAMWSDKLQELRAPGAEGKGWRRSVRGGGGHDLLTISPVLESEACGAAAAPIGLCNMLNAGGAVLEAEMAEEGTNGTRRATLRLTLRGAGLFLCYASRRPAAVLLDGAPAEGVEWDERRGALWFNVPWREDVGSGPRAVAAMFEAAAQNPSWLSRWMIVLVVACCCHAEETGRCAERGLALEHPAVKSFAGREPKYRTSWGQRCIEYREVCFDQQAIVSFDPTHSPGNLSARPIPQLNIAALTYVWSGQQGVNGDVSNYASQLYAPLAYRPASTLEASPDLRQPHFSNCSVPLVMWGLWSAHNFFEFFVRTPARVWALQQAGALSKRTTLVVGSPGGERLPPYAPILLKPLTPYEVVSFAEFSQRNPPAGAPHTTAEGAGQRCFERAYLCAWQAGYGAGTWGAAAAILQHYLAQGLPANPLGFDSGPDVLKVLIESRQGPVRNILNAQQLVDDCNRLSGSWLLDPASLIKRIQCRFISYGSDPVHDMLATASADVLVAVHGAGCTNWFFMAPGSALLEIRPYMFGSHGWADAYFPSTSVNSNLSRFFYGLNIENSQAWKPGAAEVSRGLVNRTKDPRLLRDRHVILPLDVLKEKLLRIAAAGRSRERATTQEHK